MRQLLAKANWMDGFVWFVIMAMAWSAYEFIHLGAPVTPEAIAFVLVVWGGAGAGYAILSGWFSARRAEAKNGANPGQVSQASSAPAALPQGDRAARRRAEKETRKKNG